MADNTPPVAVADLYPELSSEEQAEAEYRLLGYLSIVRRNFDRLEREGRLHEFSGMKLKGEWEKRSDNKTE